MDVNTMLSSSFLSEVQNRFQSYLFARSAPSLLALAMACGEPAPAAPPALPDGGHGVAAVSADAGADSSLDDDAGPGRVADSGSSRVADSASGPAADARLADAQAEPGERDAAVPGSAAAPARLNCPADQLGFTMVDVGELSLHVGCRGSGPTIVLLHGYPSTHAMWSDYVAPLVARGLRVVVPDQRGYNLSDKPSAVDAYHIDHLVADLAGLVEATGESKVFLAAHDWGGVVAWVYASRHPEKLRGMALMAAPHPSIWCNPEVDPVQQQASDGYIPLIVTLGEGVFLTFDLVLGPYMSEDRLGALHQAWDRPNAKISMNNWYSANVYPEVKLPRDNQVEVKTLTIWGTQDTYVTTSQIEHLPRYVRDPEVVTWETDHWFPLHSSERVLAEVLRFEATLPR
jgi:epoxide hydrolase 4